MAANDSRTYKNKKIKIKIKKISKDNSTSLGYTGRIFQL